MNINQNEQLDLPLTDLNNILLEIVEKKEEKIEILPNGVKVEIRPSGNDIQVILESVDERSLLEIFRKKDSPKGWYISSEQQVRELSNGGNGEYRYQAVFNLQKI